MVRSVAVGGDWDFIIGFFMTKLLCVFVIGLGVVAQPVLANEGRIVSDDTYKDWRAIVMQVEGGEETWRECSAMTGGDGEPVLEVTARQYDAGPPYSYPRVQIFEQAPRHYNTLMQEGGRVDFVFDDGDGYSGIAFNDVVEDVFQAANASPSDEDMLFVLQGMRRAGQLDVSYEGQLLLQASLSGFTAAYGKIAEACEFSTMGVIAPLPDEQSSGGGVGAFMSEQHGVWHAQALVFDNAGSLVTECFASVPETAGRSLSFGVNTLEYFPPEDYPVLMLTEEVAETEAPMVSVGGPVQFAFDTGLVVPGEIITNVAHDGTRFIDVGVAFGYRDVALREVSRAETLAIYGDGVVIYQSALDGFRGAYTAVAKACEFTTAGVLE